MSEDHTQLSLTKKYVASSNKIILRRNIGIKKIAREMVKRDMDYLRDNPWGSLPQEFIAMEDQDKWPTGDGELPNLSRVFVGHVTLAWITKPLSSVQARSA